MVRRFSFKGASPQLVLAKREPPLALGEDVHSCKEGLKVRPEIGTVVFWYSLRPNGNSDPRLGCWAFLGAVEKLWLVVATGMLLVGMLTACV